MLKKQSRLDRTSFTSVFRAGKRAHAPHFQLISLAGDEFAASVVVSKKIAKTAVSRNRLRRRIYNLLGDVARETPIHGKYIFIAKVGASTLPLRELQGEVMGLIGKKRPNTVQ